MVPKATSHKSEGHQSKSSSNNNNAFFFDACSYTPADLQRLAAASDDERTKTHIPLNKVSKEDMLKLQPMTFFEEAVTAVFLLFGVPNGVFSMPGVTYLIGRFVLGDVGLAFKYLAMLLIPLVLIPQPFVPSVLTSWMSCQVLKYFSFRFILIDRPPTQTPCGAQHEKDPPTLRPQILVAPPHGVFPYGNLLAMLVWPSLTGHHFIGLAASMALRVPVFKQILRGMGVVDASRQTARKALEQFPFTIGISTGGVAEVFENNKSDECVILRERVGLIKLAIRTGADLVPCYIFGNTKLLSCWHGDGIPGAQTLLEKLSRKIGFALILFYGRFGLPIPYRLPVLAVKGKPIPTWMYQCEEPSDKVIEQVQTELIKEMDYIFNAYKHLYGWEDKRLIIR
jgi:1-acyl-sn-glycerol-3-phosphate acyltransferase